MLISLMQERFSQLSRPCLLEHDGELSAELQTALPWMCRRVRQEQEWSLAQEWGDGTSTSTSMSKSKSTSTSTTIVAAGNKGAGDRIGEPKMFEGEVRSVVVVVSVASVAA